MIPADGIWTAAGECPNPNAGTLGSRGSRSHSAPARPVPERPERSPGPVDWAAGTPNASRWWLDGMLAGFAAGSLIGSSLFGASWPYLICCLLVVGIVLFGTFLRRRPAAPTQLMQAAVSVPSSLDTSPGDSSLDGRVRDIRQTDRRFDPAKFAGYTGMVFRDVENAWVTRDIGSLRDRLSAELYGELQARCDRLRRNVRQLNRIDRIEIRAEITEAWQESGQDYLTAYIGGSMVDSLATR
jgi:predicted lipid-binding transport protein (Tim44 family)